MRSSKLCSNCFASLSWNYSSNPKHAGQKSSVLQNKKQYAGDLLTHCAPPKPCATALVLANVWKTKKVESFFQAGCSNGDELMEHFVFLVTVRSTTVFFQHSETFIASSLVAMCSACCPTFFFLYQELQSNMSTAYKKQSNDWFIVRILIVLMFLLGFYMKHFPRDQIAQQWLVPGISNRTRRRGVLFERCCGEIWICRGCCMANKRSDKDKNGSTNSGTFVVTRWKCIELQIFKVG